MKGYLKILIIIGVAIIAFLIIRGIIMAQY